MPKKTNIKRTVAIAISTIALIGSLGFVGTYAYAQPSGSDTSISSCGKAGKALADAKRELANAEASGDKERIKRAEARYIEASIAYKKCMDG